MPKRNVLSGEPPFMRVWVRSMTSSKRVQDRTREKRVQELEIATEKWKIASKVLFLMEVLKGEQDMIMTVRSLEQYRRQINLPKPHKISDFIRKSPKLFELYKDQRGVLWCGMTKEAEDLLDEHGRLIEENGDKAAEYVIRWLMMSVDKKLPLDKIVHFRRDFGLPLDFRTNWVYNFPQHFKVIKHGDGENYLELVSWNLAWAITELEKRNLHINQDCDHKPGVFLTEAYDGPELIEKCPLVLWKEKLLRFTGYRGRKREIHTYSDTLDMEERELLESGSGDDNLSVGFEDDDYDDDEMNIDEVSDAYEKNNKV